MKRAIGIGLIFGGVSLVVVHWGMRWAWIGGVAVVVLGGVFLVLGYQDRAR